MISAFLRFVNFFFGTSSPASIAGSFQLERSAIKGITVNSFLGQVRLKLEIVEKLKFNIIDNLTGAILKNIGSRALGPFGRPALRRTEWPHQSPVWPGPLRVHAPRGNHPAPKAVWAKLTPRNRSRHGRGQQPIGSCCRHCS